MKKYLILIASALLAVVSCNKVEDGPSSSGEKVRLQVSITGGAATKATTEDTADEAKVNSLQVFCFNGDVLDGYRKLEGVTSLTITTTTGQHEIYALVNCPDFSSVTSMDELKAKVSEINLKNGSSYVNTGSNFEMVGHETVQVSDAIVSGGVTIHVQRLAARIQLEKITRKFTGTTLAGLSADKVKVTRIYLTNVVADSKYDFSSMSHKWLSSSLNSPAAIQKDFSLVYADVNPDAAVAQDESYAQPFSFYCYPNAASADGADARVTRLIVEMSIDGQLYTYPVFIENIEHNHSYTIRELIITKKGNESNGDDTPDPGEEKPVVSVDVDFNIVVEDWELVLVGNNGTVTL